MTFILGLTGGIGSGKSAASHWFAQQGIVIVDADIVAREIVAQGSSILEEIQQTFGHWVLQPDKTLDRRALREYIFKEPLARQQLEAITHPAIRLSITQQLQAANSPYVILVSPLLFETNQHELVQRSLLIDASIELQIQRTSQRDDQEIQQIEKIIAVQMSRLEKQKRADDILLNDGDLSHLYEKLSLLHQQYLIFAKEKKQS